MKIIDRSIVGSRTEEFTTSAERGRLRFFAEATAQSDPVYTDLSAAKAAGHPDLPIPPTFFFCLEMDNPNRHVFLANLGVDVRTILHGGQKFTYHAPAHAGDVLTYWTEVADVSSKKGGALQFIVRNTHVSRAGEPVATLTSTIVVRDPKAAS
ncbi:MULTISPECIES: MaoC family dehydratase N-terminal domain-containing protein [Rhodococcus]|uniref:MaoC family dehydratase N-terminal domain-containing protein n=1 Tax=Rhodococcus aetherivorans TaxID=191292 RepID=A0AA46SDJ7_9NOCA|nr:MULTISPECIES: MaoC family dehydratase N-terminal domain-containing protein [Rhodococcus]AKE88211.1 acyl dehydratase [Rhodococcus aetherivorans]ANZ27162.1 acyl dehydratase [Rhodococcus sp. WB1]MBC2592258.1 MaoC family dehydratase N-terminal domain-containing protein [Rhodococcus aetherivorans]QIX48482.1 MaoC family dehydratase [Rhodococcus sp. DMU1]UGQ40958.1 MaoC family dehydratase N-terminal domain-containing protein [Rhodococcus aetherivorans]